MTTFIKNTTLAAVATLAGLTLFAALPAQAQEAGNFIVRLRALHLDAANKDSTGLNLSVNNKTFPELDFAYFITPNVAAELVLTYPQKHTLYSNGGKIGTLKHLPPTLLGQYHFTGLGGFRPYVGAGLNFTNFSDVQFEPAVVTALKPNVKRTSWGLAAQVGADVPLGGGWLLNVDLKKVQIKTDVYAGTAKAGTFKIDPLLLSVGVGLRF
jgi:outer membrane protein